MFPSAPPPKHHVQFALKLSVRFTPPAPLPAPPKSPSLIYLQIAKSDLPSNRQVRLTLKSSVWFTPHPKSPSPIYPKIANCNLPSNRLYDLPPQNGQVRFTLKSPTAIYPQIICTIYPPPPEIAKSDLPSNHQLRFTLKLSVRFTHPRNCQVRFTLKLPTAIYPQIVCMIYSPSPLPPEIAKSDLPSNRQLRFTLKSSVWFTPPKKIGKSNWPSNHQVWFTLKSPVWFTPSPGNCQVRFTLKSPSPINPQIICTIYPPSPSP